MEETKKDVELFLLGIDKTWVRSPKGEWVDKNSLAPKVNSTIFVTEESEEYTDEKSAWWKFWK